MRYTITIIGVCVVVFLFELFSNSLVNLLSFNPQYALNMPWQFITSIFIHGSFTHLFLNMFVLFFFGLRLEKWIGGANFLKIFFISGIAGNIAYLLYSYSTNQYIPAVGASGAISGIIGALTILDPNMEIMIFPFPIPIKLKYATILFAGFEILCLIFSIMPTIGHAAHLGGLFTGMLCGKLLNKRYISYYY
ncbi:rhomboid family intramembrane serine protease [Methanothermococcus okinawensis]|uniref:Rhomboid family protein n=1 Tax=Methanothermococcus okinawensis (strain DSM 14208 / JCM 11175 / IH1) TaxID=647113 RepID=F8ALE6_METOI|nr:rhomboid family intramembrane serine protease [Methanothermococcus okinawensis]AEH06534.1 Rhomboid family protein [Methanothermococcus okinawensis IH1]